MVNHPKPPPQPPYVTIWKTLGSVVLSGIHKMVDICQTDDSIHSKLRIFPYSEVIHGNTIFKLTEG